MIQIPSKCPLRKAFTLIELLVVIAIIALLIALLLPGVQRVREAAWRTACANNLRQLGLAALQYHQTHNRLPPAGSSGPSHNWPVFVLSYVEQKNLMNKYNFNKNWNHNSNQPVVRTQIPLLYCPSTPSQNRLDSRSGQTLACTDYSTPVHISPELWQTGFMSMPKNRWAAIVNNESLSLDEIGDGASNTLIYTEDSGRPEHWVTAGQWGNDNNSCGNFNVTGGRVNGGGWADPHNTIPLHGFTRNGLNCNGPCAVNCTNNNEPYSFHPEGINAVFADGHVHFIRQTITIPQFAALITANGGETYNLDY